MTNDRPLHQPLEKGAFKETYLGIDSEELPAHVGHDDSPSLRVDDLALAVRDLGRGPHRHSGMPRQEGSVGSALGGRHGGHQECLLVMWDLFFELNDVG